MTLPDAQAICNLFCKPRIKFEEWISGESDDCSGPVNEADSRSFVPVAGGNFDPPEALSALFELKQTSKCFRSGSDLDSEPPTEKSRSDLEPESPTEKSRSDLDSESPTEKSRSAIGSTSTVSRGRPATSNTRRAMQSRTRYLERKQGAPTLGPGRPRLQNGTFRNNRRQQLRKEKDVVEKAKSAFANGDMEAGCDLQALALQNKTGRKAFQPVASLVD